jgi:23S rRNA (uracil1939-C5)-methyltransferase
LKPKNSPTLKFGDVVELTIDSLSYSGGRGVGRLDGMVIFVPAAAPGDRIRARITEVKPRFAEAEGIEILSPGPGRREPPCPVAHRCGGCSWQHVRYDVQVAQKQGILDSSLRGLAKLGDFTRPPFLAAPEEFHYRNRIQLQVQDGKFGFFAKRSNALVEVRECWISEPALNEKLRRLSAADAAGQARVELALREDGELVTTAGRRSPEAALFAQVNRAQNEVLKERVLAVVEGRPDWILDLYAGSGNLSFPLAGQFSPMPVTAVELSAEAVERGRERSRRLKQTNLHWEAGDVGRVLARWSPPQGLGTIILDPPRTGCANEVTDQLIRLRARQIVYVSCNPATFARDTERLVKSGRYRLQSVQGLDMFPQTEHVELIASLCAAPN